jgi:hypothetical protein
MTKTLLTLAAAILAVAVLGPAAVSQERLQRRAGCPPITWVTPSPLPPTTIGWDYQHQLEVRGGVAPITFANYPATRPDGTPGGGLGPGQLTFWKGLASYYHGPPNVEPDHNANLWVAIDGLALTASGLIHGQPKMSGNFTLIIYAIDSCPSVKQRVYKRLAFQVRQPT